MIAIENGKAINKGHNFDLYDVTYKNGITTTVTAYCLVNCYLNSIDESVDSYVKTYCAIP